MSLFTEEEMQEIRSVKPGPLFSPEEMNEIKAVKPNNTQPTQYEVPSFYKMEDQKKSDPYDITGYLGYDMSIPITQSNPNIKRVTGRVLSNLSSSGETITRGVNDITSWMTQKAMELASGSPDVKKTLQDTGWMDESGKVTHKLRFDILDRAAETYAMSKGYWDEYIEKQGDPGKVQEFFEQVFAGIASGGVGAAEFSLGTLYAGVKGATAAQAQGKSQLLGFAKEAALRGTLGYIFKKLHPLANQGTIGNIKQVILGGGVFSGETALRSKLEGHKITGEALGESFITGAVFSYNKKNPKLKALEEARDTIKASEELTKKYGGELAGIETAIGEFNKPFSIISDAKNFYNNIKDIPEYAQKIVTNKKGFIDLNIIDKILKRDKDIRLLNDAENRVTALNQLLNSRESFVEPGMPMDKVQPGTKLQVTIKNESDRYVPVEADYVQNSKGMVFLNIHGSMHAFPAQDVGLLRVLGESTVTGSPEFITPSVLKKSPDTLFVHGGDISDKAYNDKKLGLTDKDNLNLIPIMKNGVLFKDAELKYNAPKILEAIDNIRRKLIGVDANHDIWGIVHYNYDKTISGVTSDPLDVKNYGKIKHAPGWEVGDRVWLSSTDGRKTLIEITDVINKKMLIEIEKYNKETKEIDIEDRWTTIPKEYRFKEKKKDKTGKVQDYTGPVQHLYKFSIVEKPLNKQFKDIIIPNDVGEALMEKSPATYNFILNAVNSLRDFGTGLRQNTGKPDRIVIKNSGDEVFVPTKKADSIDVLGKTKTVYVDEPGQTGWQYKNNLVATKIEPAGFLNDGRAVYKTEYGLVTRDGVLLNKTQSGFEKAPVPIRVPNITYFSKSYESGKKQQKTVIQEALEKNRTSIILPSELVEGLSVGDIMDMSTHKGDSLQVRVKQIDLDINGRMIKKNPDAKSEYKFLPADPKFVADVARTENIATPFKAAMLFSPTYMGKDKYGLTKQSRVVFELIKTDKVTDREPDLVTTYSEKTVDTKSTEKSKQEPTKEPTKAPEVEDLTPAEREYKQMYTDFKDAIALDDGLFHSQYVRRTAETMAKYSDKYDAKVIDSVRKQAEQDVMNNPYNMTLMNYMLKTGRDFTDIDISNVDPTYKAPTPKEVTAAWGQNEQTRGQIGTSLRAVINNNWYNYFNGTLTYTLPSPRGGGFREVTFYGKNLAEEGQDPFYTTKTNIDIWREAKIRAYESGKIDKNSEQALSDYIDDPILWDRYGKTSIHAKKIGDSVELSHKAYERGFEVIKEDIDAAMKPLAARVKSISPETESQIGRKESGEIVESKFKQIPEDTKQSMSNEYKETASEVQQSLGKQAVDLVDDIKSFSSGGYINIDLLMRMMGLGSVSNKINQDKQMKAINAYKSAELMFWTINNESRKLGQDPREYMVNMFNKMGFQRDMDVPYEKTGQEITAERMADVFIGDYTKRVSDIQRDYIHKKNADEADRLENPYTLKEKVQATKESFKEREKESLEYAAKVIKNISKDLMFYPDLPGSARIMIDNFSSSSRHELSQYVATIEKGIFGELNKGDREIVAKLVALHSDLRLTKQKEWVTKPDGTRELVTFDRDIGAVGRNTKKVFEELTAFKKYIDRLPQKRKNQIYRARMKWNEVMREQFDWLYNEGEISKGRRKVDYAPYFIESYLPEWGSVLTTGFPSKGKMPFQGYLIQSHGTPRPRVLTSKMMMNFIGNVKHDVMIKDFMREIIAVHDISASDKLTKEQLEMLNINDKRPWGNDKERPKELINGEKYIWFQPERFKLATTFNKETGRQEIDGTKQTYLIPESLFKAFDTWSSQQNSLRVLNMAMRTWKSVAINTSWLSYNYNNLIGDTYLSLMMHPNRVQYVKEIQTGLNVVTKILEERAGITVQYSPFEVKLKDFLERNGIMDAGQTYAETGHRVHADPKKIEAELSKLSKTKEIGRYLFEGKGWHRVPNALKEVSNYRESILRAANASYCLRMVESGRSVELEKQFGFLEGKFKDGETPMDRAAIIAKEYFINYNRQSPSYRKFISGLSFPFGKWYFDMSGLHARWLFKGKNAEDSFVKAISGKSPKEIILGKGEFAKPNLKEAGRIAFEKNVGFYDGKLQLGGIPKAAALTLVSFLTSWMANYRNEDVAAVERQLPEGIRQKMHMIWGVERGRNGEILSYKMWSPQTPEDILIGAKFFNTAADVLQRYRTKEISSWDEAGKTLLKNWFGAEARGFFNLANPMIKFLKGMYTGKDPYDGTPIIPEYRKEVLTKTEQLYYAGAFFSKCVMPLFGTYVARTEYRQEKGTEVALDMAERMTGISTDMNEPLRGLLGIIGVKEMEGYQGEEYTTEAGGKAVRSRSVVREANERIDKPERKILRDIKSDWVKSGLYPEEFVETKDFQKHIESLKELHGDTIDVVAKSLEKRIDNIFKDPISAQAWIKNKIASTKDKEEKRELREMLYEAKQASFEQQYKRSTISERSHMGDILAEQLGFKDFEEFENMNQ